MTPTTHGAYITNGGGTSGTAVAIGCVVLGSLYLLCVVAVVVHVVSSFRAREGR